ncbi:MAG: hypothetical protein J6Y19_11655, partial [Kiritimatiellae bacterium]|nr:hypothetical protein [Kiritimatiellia bacterium]
MSRFWQKATKRKGADDEEKQQTRPVAPVHLASYQLKLEDQSATFPLGENPWEGDRLDRANMAEELANMLSGQRGPLTVALDGRWGTGKTFFLTRFVKVYNMKNGIAFYFNAWSDDFLEDPLLSLLGQLTTELGKNPNDTFGESLKQALGPVLKKVGFALCKSFVKNAFEIDFDDLSVDELATRGEKLLEQFGEMAAARDELCDALAKLGKKVREETGKPLLVIVDELDRCRPTYAVEMLERIKHLFSLENIVFLLGIDRLELEKSITAGYGDIDAQRYLNRFIDVDFTLPVAPLREFIRGLLIDAKLGQLFKNDSIQLERINNWSYIFSAMADATQMSLREVEHAMRKFALVLFSRTVDLSGMEGLLSAYAVALNLGEDRERYQRFLQGECKPKEIVDALFLHLDGNDFLNMNPQNPITELYACYYRQSNDKRFQSQFEAMCASLEDVEATSADRSLLPTMTEKYSLEDL